MAVIKDKLAAWYVQNFVIPKAQVLDRPGFVLFKISGATQGYSRQLIMPERFFSDLEKAVCDGLGDEGSKLLYSFGKKFGVRFSLVGNIKSFEDVHSVEFKNYVYLVARFVEGTYSSGITHQVDENNKMIEFQLNNFIICSKSGKGFFLSAGGIAGIWSKLTKDDAVEAIHFKCQGNGNEFCEVIAAPVKYLEEKFGNIIIKENNLGGLGITKDYYSFNAPVSIQNSTKSFQFFLNSNVFKYKDGIITKRDERFFIIEASVIYLVEKVFSANEKAIQILKKVSFDAGFNIVDDQNKNIGYLVDTLAALGFGDPLILKKPDGVVVNFNYFPWTEFTKESNNLFLENFISGALSKVMEKEIHLKASFSGFVGKGYSVSLS